jgi:hypothetical protein
MRFTLGDPAPLSRQTSGRGGQGFVSAKAIAA